MRLRNIISVIIILLPLLVFCQPDKKDVLIGGSLSGSPTYGFSSYQCTATPLLGVFLSDVWFVGTSPSASLSYRSFSKTFNASFELGLFGRYYFNTGDKANLWPQLSGSFLNNPYNSKETGFSTSAGLGFSYWLHESTSLELLVNYRIYDTINGAFIATLPELKIGISFLLNRSSKTE